MAPAELTPVLAPVSALASVGDPARTRTVYIAIALLVLLGVAMIVLAVWLVRRTRFDPPVLGPLEVMGDRSWRRADDPEARSRRLEEARPEGALTLAAIAPMLSLDPDDDEVASDGADVGVGSHGEPLGAPAATHAATPDEIDAILQRFDPPSVSEESEARAVMEADDEPAERGDEAAEDDASLPVDDAADPAEDDAAALADDTTSPGDDEPPDQSAEPDDVVQQADAPDEQPTHG